MPQPLDFDDICCLESLLDGLRRVEDGDAKIVSYGVREDTDGRKVLTMHDSDSEEYLYPDVLDRLMKWCKTLPNNPPAE